MRAVPNIITIGRLIMVPVTVYCLLTGELEAGFWLFVAAGVSDAVDGAIARLCDARTVLGAYLDPLADKALLVCVYLSLAKIGLMPLWLVVLVVSRDLLIVGWVLLSYTLRQPETMKPLFISKANTFAQLTLAALVLAVSGLELSDPVVLGVRVAAVLQGLVAATTVLSGFSYLATSKLLAGGGGQT
ncbi:MAG: CDP-alcohol phosphatidyltransferase family protein [Rhodospirillaceae bacterium]